VGGWTSRVNRRVLRPTLAVWRAGG
jgi:hypothetical protein